MMTMGAINKIFIFRVNNVSSNGTISFSSTIIKGSSINVKELGGQSITGDFCLAKNFEKNILIDPDFIDQSKKKAI
jgi:hypothetical protein